jgi:hypothetical protein
MKPQLTVFGPPRWRVSVQQELQHNLGFTSEKTKAREATGTRDPLFFSIFAAQYLAPRGPTQRVKKLRLPSILVFISVNSSDAHADTGVSTANRSCTS